MHAELRLISCVTISCLLAPPLVSAATLSNAAAHASKPEPKIAVAEAGALEKATLEAQQAYIAKDFPTAEAKYKEALLQTTKSPAKVQIVLLSNLGAAYREDHKYVEAEESFRKAINLAGKAGLSNDPSTLLTMKQYALLLRKLKKGDEADAMEGKASASAPYGDTAYGAGRGRNIIAAYNEPQNPNFNNSIPDIVAAMEPASKNLDAATITIEELKVHLRRNPQDLNGWSTLVQKSAKAKDWAGAIDGLTNIEKRFRDHEKEAIVALAFCYFNAGQWTDAIDRCKRAIALDPEQGDMYRVLSVSCGRVGDLKQKLETDEAFVEKFPSHADHSTVSEALPYLKRDVEKLSNQTHGTAPTETELKKSWIRAKMPLKVYVNERDDDSIKFENSASLITDNTPGQIIQRAMDTWTQASQGRISFVLTPKMEEANITCAFTKDPDGLENDFAAGITEWETQTSHPHAKIKLLTVDRQSGQTIERGEFFETCLHEFGHALGLEHSSAVTDVMYRAVHPEPILMLSDTDRERIVKLYTWHP